MIADDISEYVEASVKLYNSEQDWHDTQKDCSILLSSRYDSQKLGKDLIKKITAAESNLEQHRLNNFTGSMLKHHSMMSTRYMSQWIEEKNKKPST